jgi:putative oxidoreductase
MNAAFTLGRIFLVAIFIISGATKLLDIAGTADQIQSKLAIPSALTETTGQVEAAVGMPIWQVLAIVVALIEVVGGLLIAFNVLTRAAAVMLFLFVAVTTFYFHDFWNLPSGPDKTNNMIHALKNLSMMGAFLMLAAWPRRPVIVETTVPEHVVHDRAEPL